MQIAESVKQYQVLKHISRPLLVIQEFHQIVRQFKNKNVGLAHL